MKKINLIVIPIGFVIFFLFKMEQKPENISQSEIVKVEADNQKPLREPSQVRTPSKLNSDAGPHDEKITALIRAMSSSDSKWNLTKNSNLIVSSIYFNKFRSISRNSKQEQELANTLFNSLNLPGKLEKVEYSISDTSKAFTKSENYQHTIDGVSVFGSVVQLTFDRNDEIVLLQNHLYGSYFDPASEKIAVEKEAAKGRILNQKSTLTNFIQDDIAEIKTWDKPYFVADDLNQLHHVWVSTVQTKGQKSYFVFLGTSDGLVKKIQQKTLE